MMLQLQLEKRYWLFMGLVILSWIPTLFFPYVGEEAVYTISSLEMWQNNEMWVPYLYGGLYQRPPLFNWLIIPLANTLGWPHMLKASRLISLCASLGSGFLLSFFVHKIFKDKYLARFTALMYLCSVDMLLRRAWLAYADPLFAFFVLGGIAFLWIACSCQQKRWLILAGLCVSAGFLTKAITVYVFYGVAYGSLLLNKKYRKFLLNYKVIGLQCLIIAFPLLWYSKINTAVAGTGMVEDILGRLQLLDVKAYGLKLLLYPFDTLYRFLPWSFIAGFIMLRPSVVKRALLNSEFKFVSLMLLINYLPYWFSPESHTRYLQPLYPFISFVFAYSIWQWGRNSKMIGNMFLILILVNAAVHLSFPFSNKVQAKKYLTAAHDIQQRVGNAPLYSNNDSATGLSLSAQLDILRLPQAALVRPPASLQTGYVLGYGTENSFGKIVARYSFGKTAVFLMCKGSGC